MSYELKQYLHFNSFYIHMSINHVLPTTILIKKNILVNIRKKASLIDFKIVFLLIKKVNILLDKGSFFSFFKHWKSSASRDLCRFQRVVHRFVRIYYIGHPLIQKEERGKERDMGPQSATGRRERVNMLWQHM